MNISFCIGNGPSRKNFDLKKLKDIGPTYGCNRLVETFDVDNSIVVDRIVLIDLIAQGYNKKTNIYTRKRYSALVEAENLRYLEDPIKDPLKRWDMESQWGSGVHALNLAASQGADIIIMLGYDLYDKDKSPDCWIYQIKRCFELYRDIQFVQIQSAKWKCPEDWAIENFSTDNYKGLNKLLKDSK